MESHPSFELESRGSRRMRRRPLHSAGVSFLAIASVACAKANTLDLNQWPTLLLAMRFVKRAAKMMAPLLSFIQSLCFPLLSFVDDYILAGELVSEKLFPTSAHVFNKIDQLLQFADTLPVKLDDAITRLPIVIHEVPSLDWALGHVISFLNFILLHLRGRRQERTAEKEIMVDSSCSEDRPAVTQFQNGENFGPATQTHEKESEGVKEEAMDDITKEVSEKGTEKDVENEEEVIAGVEMNTIKRREEEEEEQGERKEASENGSKEESRVDEDQILELFESGWLMKQARK